MSERIHTKVLIIGAGPAGYTAAIYAARANLKPILVQGLQPGGQLMITTDVENYPGFADVIQGPWLMEEMAKQAEHVGTKLVSDIIVSCDLTQRPFVCTADSGDIYIADALVICTGAQARWLGLPSEDQFRGAGDGAVAFFAERAGGFVIHLHDFAGVNDAHAMVAKTAFGQRGVDFGLMADQEKGGDVFVVLQGLFDAGNDNATTVIAAHDIHCNSHGKF